VANTIHIGDMGKKKNATTSSILIISIVVVLAQIIIAPNIAINGVGPNLILIGIVLIARQEQQTTACLVGFALGLIYDLVGTAPLGVMAFMLALAGYAIASSGTPDSQNMMVGNAPRGDWVSDLVVFAITALCVEIGYAIVLSLTGYEASFASAIVYRILPSLIYDCVCALIVFALRNRIKGGSSRTKNPRQLGR